MKIIYDPEVDVLRIIFSNSSIEESDEQKPGIILDFDKGGNVVRWRIGIPGGRRDCKILGGVPK